MKNFKEIRLALHLSQQELANQLGISQQAIAKYENPENEVPESIIMLMEAKLHVNRQYLETGSGDMFTENSEIIQYKEKYREILNHLYDLDIEELERLNKFIRSGLWK